MSTRRAALRIVKTPMQSLRVLRNVSTIAQSTTLSSEPNSAARIPRSLLTTDSCTLPPKSKSLPTTRFLPFSTSRTHSLAEAKDALQDKDALNPTSTEYSQTSPGGDANAAHTDVAFDPQTTSPEGQHGQSKREAMDKGAGGAGEGSNPLEMSPANKDVRDWDGSSSQGDGGKGSASTEYDTSRSQRERLESAESSGGGNPVKSGGKPDS